MALTFLTNGKVDLGAKKKVFRVGALYGVIEAELYFMEQMG